MPSMILISYNKGPWRLINLLLGLSFSFPKPVFLLVITIKLLSIYSCPLWTKDFSKGSLNLTLLLILSRDSMMLLLRLMETGIACKLLLVNQTLRNFQSSANYFPSPVYTTDLPTQDPHTMNIDVLQTNNRETLMRASAYFYCKERGHLACNCPRKSRTNYHILNHNLPTHFPQNSSQNNQTPSQPRTRTINIATIKATLEALTEEERSQLISSMEDFPRGNWTQWHPVSFLSMYDLC